MSASSTLLKYHANQYHTLARWEDYDIKYLSWRFENLGNGSTIAERDGGETAAYLLNIDLPPSEPFLCLPTFHPSLTRPSQFRESTSPRIRGVDGKPPRPCHHWRRQLGTLLRTIKPRTENWTLLWTDDPLLASTYE